MSIAEHEQRIRALEAAVIELRSKVPTPGSEGSDVDEEGMLMDVERPLIPGTTPKESKRFRARITVVQKGRRDLGLSSAELARLSLGDIDE